MSRLLPYPGLSIALALLWVLLNNAVTPATLVGAVLVGLAAPWALVPLEMPRARVKRFGSVFRLIGVVLYDVVRSNLSVAAIILSGARRQRNSGFVSIQLDLRNQFGLALLAIIITSTPGTLWAQHDIERNRLLLHVFDLVDDADWVALIKGRYERLLMEIFE